MGSGTHVALLRGINVGGRNRLPMKALADLFEAAGAKDVRTYIQSGNVVYGASAALAKQLPDTLQAAIAKEFGLDIPVVTRSAKRWRVAIAANPYIAQRIDVSQLHVAFLAAKPTARQLAALDPRRSPPDGFQALGSELYLHCPGGMARTKLTNAYFDRILETVSTVRNWTTVLRIGQMCDDG